MKHDLTPAIAERLDLLILAINRNTAAIEALTAADVREQQRILASLTEDEIAALAGMNRRRRR